MNEKNIKSIKKTILNSLNHYKEDASLYGNTIKEIEEAIKYIESV
jgi:hypothetical protein